MPNYEFVCKACDHRFEVSHSVNEPHPEKCPECHKKKLQQVFFAVPALLKLSPLNPRRNRGRGY